MMNVNITIRQIAFFVAIAEEGGFRRAASRLGRSQSAVSSQVALLEAQLGVKLLSRSTRAVELTDDGKIFLQRAKRGMDDILGAINQIQQGSRDGTVRFAASQSVSATLLPAVCSRIEKVFPKMKLQIVEAYADQIVDLLSADKVDFAVGPSMINQIGFEFKEVFTEDFFAIIPDQYGMKGVSEIEASRLADFEVIAIPPGAEMQRTLSNLFERRNASHSEKIQVQHGQTLIAMAEAGLGIAVVPAIYAATFKPSNSTVARVVNPALSRTVNMITRKGRQLSPSATRCSDKVCSLLEDLGPKLIGRLAAVN